MLRFTDVWDVGYDVMTANHSLGNFSRSEIRTLIGGPRVLEYHATVDGQNPAPPSMMISYDYPIIYRVLTIPGGAGFHPSTVSIILSWSTKTISKKFRSWKFLRGDRPFLGMVKFVTTFRLVGFFFLRNEDSNRTTCGTECRQAFSYLWYSRCSQPWPLPLWPSFWRLDCKQELPRETLIEMKELSTPFHLDLHWC